MTSTVSCKEKPEEFKKNDFYFLVIQEDEKLSAVRKVPETTVFQALGIIETLGSMISHGTSTKFADVRTHLRKVFNRTLAIIQQLKLPL